ncbi:MAG: protein kinase [bacterium]|nr:protein kinase [bacterium]
MPADGSQDDRTESFIALSSGTLVSHYKIIEKIGAGGMGEVYLAEDTALERKVALKFLPPHLCQDEECRQRFMREARAIAKISHPNIITIYEVAEVDGRPYLAIELIEGGSLKDKIEGDGLDLEQALDLAVQICEALSFVHRSGIVHRDIKPSNILVEKTGLAHLADFGLVHMGSATELTRPGSRMGTWGYMSPEQAAGEPVDNRSDIFSLGVVLYEALTGCQPFLKASEAASLEAVLRTEADSISRIRPDVPLGLQRMVERMIAKSPSDRFQNADDLRVEMKKQQEGLLRGTDPREVRIESEFDNGVLVMCFRNMLDPGDAESQAEIIANLLITGLSESRDFRVVSSQQVYDILKRLDKDDSPSTDPTLSSQVARTAKARWMILGTLLRTRPTLLLTSQIVEVDTGHIVSAQRLTSHQDEDIFLFTDRLLRQLFADLPISKSGKCRLDRSVTEVTTSSQEAYRSYLEGLEYSYRYLDSEAEKCFELALKHDPTFAMAYYRRARRPACPFREELIRKAVEYSDRASRKERLYISAMEARIEGEYGRCLSQLEEIISQYPEEKEALLLLGNLHRLSLGEVQEGVRYYEEVLRIDPDNIEAYTNLTYAYNTMGEYHLSLQAANKLAELAPDQPNSFDSLGDICSWNGEIDQGLDAFLRAIEIDERFFHSIWKAGILYTFKQQFAESQGMFRKLTACDDSDYRACGRMSLGMIPYCRGKFRDALSALDTGLSSDEMEDYQGYFRAYKHLLKGKIHLERKDISRAIDDIRSSIELFRAIDPAVLYPSVTLCQALAIGGDTHGARSVLQEIETSLKKHRRGRRSVYHAAAGLVDLSQGQCGSALRNLSKAAEDPLIWEWEGVNRFELFTTLGQAHVMERSYEKAVDLLESIKSEYSLGRLAAAISSAKVHYFLGIAYGESGWKAKAISNFETFLTIWKDADPGVEEIEDARQRLIQLKSNP